MYPGKRKTRVYFSRAPGRLAIRYPHHAGEWKGVPSARTSPAGTLIDAKDQIKKVMWWGTSIIWGVADAPPNDNP